MPVIETETLILRGPDRSDFEHLAELRAVSERSWGMGGLLSRDHAFGSMGFTTMTSNSRSVAFAQRLGATLCEDAERRDDSDVVYRHRVAA